MPTFSMNDLQKGDIILTAGSTVTSLGIQFGSFSKYSHAMLYIGGSLIIEAVGDADGGVRQMPLNKAIHGTFRSDVFRHNEMNSRKADAIINLAKSIRGKATKGANGKEEKVIKSQGAKYDTRGVIGAATCTPGAKALGLSSPFGIGSAPMTATCEAAKLGLFDDKKKYFCSELIYYVYRAFGLTISGHADYMSTPKSIAYSQRLKQVGALK